MRQQITTPDDRGVIVVQGPAPGTDIVADMLRATEARFKGKAGPETQFAIVEMLKAQGYSMGIITDYLPHLMFHLGHTEDVL